ncbi:CehA/McbA family metallohydrolase [Methanolobus halotolerans]|uniref:Histidinol-phosphatase n=1 Tax=Methanolobus halotolerans TaxID=2052935 RepID=A0A4E0R211_9EURY|nr:PHP domain-containing protein [Methanolobus halotolerans]TGC11393.1 histidinol-phosphatase [Methanolobus halotolerans]
MRFDLHVHSIFSKDSNARPDEILEYASRNGLDGFAICDHDSIEGGIECAKRAQEIGSKQIVIPGVEVSSSKGHILVLGVKESIEPGLSPEETIRKAHEQDAVVVIPHPFKISSHGIGYLDGLDIDAVEVLNSRCMTKGPNNKARKSAEGLGLPQVAGSDAHEARMVGRSYTEIDASDRSVKAVLDAIRAGRTSACGHLTPASFVIKQMFAGHLKKARTRLRGSGRLHIL